MGTEAKAESKKTKLSPKREAFALAVIKTGDYSAAYRAVYNVKETTKPESVWSRASNLVADVKVAERLKELRAEMMDDGKATLDKVIQTLKDAMRIAEEQADPSAMVRAAVALGKAQGLIIDQQKVSVLGQIGHDHSHEHNHEHKPVSTSDEWLREMHGGGPEAAHTPSVTN